MCLYVRLKMRNTRMQSFVRGLPSSLFSLATRLFLVLSFLIAYGRCDNVENNVDLVALLRGTLKFWRQIYNTHHDEISLGYCWADYLFGLRDFESLTIPRLLHTDDFVNMPETSNGWRYENDSTNRGRFSYGNYSRIVTDVRSDHSYLGSPLISATNHGKISRRDVKEEYANFQNDINFSYKQKQPVFADLTEFVRGSKKREENSRLKRLRRKRDRVAENVEGSFQERATSTRKVSSSPRQKLPTTHRFFFKSKGRVRRHIEPYARNIFEKEVPTETGVERLGSLATRKVFDRDKITAHTEEFSSLEDHFGNETEESKEKKDINDREEAAASLSTEKYEGRSEIRSDGIESQGRRSSRFSLVTRDRSVKRILSTLSEHPIFIAVLRTLTILVRLGRLITEIVASSKVLSCTRDYFWSKAIEWIDA